MKRSDIAIVEITNLPGEREVVLYNKEGNKVSLDPPSAFSFAPTSPIGQCVNLLIRLCLLQYKEST